jgi:hypothetical protein
MPRGTTGAASPTPMVQPYHLISDPE